MGATYVNQKIFYKLYYMDYKNKYLKYKSKYLNLKNSLDEESKKENLKKPKFNGEIKKIKNENYRELTIKEENEIYKNGLNFKDLVKKYEKNLGKNLGKNLEKTGGDLMRGRYIRRCYVESTGWQVFYNTSKILQRVYPRYFNGYIGSLRGGLSCNLWIWSRELNVWGDINNRTHLDIFYNPDDQRDGFFKIGVSVKLNNEHIDRFYIEYNMDDENYIPLYIAQDIVSMFNYYYGNGRIFYGRLDEDFR